MAHECCFIRDIRQKLILPSHNICTFKRLPGFGQMQLLQIFLRVNWIIYTVYGKVEVQKYIDSVIFIYWKNKFDLFFSRLGLFPKMHSSLFYSFGVVLLSNRIHERINRERKIPAVTEVSCYQWSVKFPPLANVSWPANTTIIHTLRGKLCMHRDLYSKCIDSSSLSSTFLLKQMLWKYI